MSSFPQTLEGTYNITSDWTDAQTGTVSLFMKGYGRFADSPNLFFTNGEGTCSFRIGPNFAGTGVNLELISDETQIFNDEIAYRDDDCFDGLVDDYDMIMANYGWCHIVLQIYRGEGVLLFSLFISVWDGFTAGYSEVTESFPLTDFFGEDLESSRFYFAGGLGGGSGQVGTLFRDITFVDGASVEPGEFASLNSETGEITPIVYTGSLGNGGWYLTGPGETVGDTPSCAVEFGENELQDYYSISDTNIEFTVYTEDLTTYCTPQIIQIPCEMFMCEYTP